MSIRTQFAAFAQGSQEAVLNATSHDQTVNFELILASRQPNRIGSRRSRAARQGSERDKAFSQLAGNAPENLSLMNALTADTDTGAGTAGASGAALPSIAGNSDFSDESVADHRAGGPGERRWRASISDRMRDAVQIDSGAGRIERARSRRKRARAAYLADTAAVEDSAEPSAAVVLAGAADSVAVAEASADGGGGGGGGGRGKLPQLQSRPAARRHRLERNATPRS